MEHATTQLANAFATPTTRGKYVQQYIYHAQTIALHQARELVTQRKGNVCANKDFGVKIAQTKHVLLTTLHIAMN